MVADQVLLVLVLLVLLVLVQRSRGRAAVLVEKGAAAEIVINRYTAPSKASRQS
jgi:preprotein translocase subunit SecG